MTVPRGAFHWCVCGYLAGCSPLLSLSALTALYRIRTPDPWSASGSGCWNPTAGSWAGMPGRRRLGRSARSGGSGNCGGKNGYMMTFNSELKTELNHSEVMFFLRVDMSNLNSNKE